MYRSILTTFSVVALAGCGGSGPNTAEALSEGFQAIESAAGISFLDANDDLLAPTSDIHIDGQSGKATFKGIAGYDLSLTSVMLGTTELNADFDDNTISGKAENFGRYTDDGNITELSEAALASILQESYTGTLTIAETSLFQGSIVTTSPSPGVIVTSGNNSIAYTTSMTGTLTGERSNTENVDLTLEGYIFEFDGTGNRVTAAFGTGTITSGDGFVLELVESDFSDPNNEIIGNEFFLIAGEQ